MMASHILCRKSAAILVRQSKPHEDREIGRRFKPLWEVLAPKLQDSSRESCPAPSMQDLEETVPDAYGLIDIGHAIQLPVILLFAVGFVLSKVLHMRQ